jgi:RHS repeat-associated protein
LTSQGDLSFGYDLDSDITSVTYPNSQTVSFGFNNMDQETSLQDWLGNTTQFGYDSAARLNSTTFPNGITQATVYDADSQVSLITDTSGSSTVASFNYTSPTPRNADEELMSETDTGTPGPSTQSYTHDTLKRVTTDNSASYNYNLASQLTTGPGGAAQSFDPAGQLCWSMPSPPEGSSCSSPPSGSTTYSFNADGERTGSTSGSSTSSYAWNEHGDLTSTTTGSTTVGYTYNASGLLSTRTQGSSSDNFVWDPVGATDPLLVDDGTNYYIYGPDDLATEQISVGSATVDYYLHDQLGSTRLLTSSSGAVAGSWTYNAWGQTVATGSGGSGGGGGTTTTTTAATTTTTHPTTTTTAGTTTTTTGCSSSSITAVGSLAQRFGSNTLSVSPVNIGDIEALAIQGQPESSPVVASVSGGGVSTWSKAIAYPGSATSSDIEIWWGKVTSTGSSTITVTWTGSNPSYRELDAQEFTAGSGATWSVDKTGDASNSSATSYNMASLTPSGSSELYYGLAVVGGDTATAGSTSGVTYNVDDNGNLLAYDTNVSAALAPAGSQTGGTGVDSAAALFIASAGSCGGTTTTTAGTTTTTVATTTTQPTTTTTSGGEGGGTTATTPLLWAGQYQDPTTGLYYMRARWYDPTTGEFLSVDPDFNQTLDAYGYADENPLDGTDPSGLYNTAADSIQCEYDPSACNPTTTGVKATYTPLNTKVGATASEEVTYPTTYSGGAPQPGQIGIPIPTLTPSQQQAAGKAASAFNTTLSDAGTLASLKAQLNSLTQTCKGVNTSSTCANYGGTLYGLETDIQTEELALQGAISAYYWAGEALAQALTSPGSQPSVWHDVLVGFGIALGLASVALGVGTIVFPEAAVALGAGATVAGFGATVIDGKACVDGDNVACIGAGLVECLTIKQ